MIELKPPELRCEIPHQNIFITTSQLAQTIQPRNFKVWFYESEKESRVHVLPAARASTDNHMDTLMHIKLFMIGGRFVYSKYLCCLKME